MNRLRFDGKGFAFFKILFVDFFAFMFSLGLLYPWINQREINYLWRHTTLDNTLFQYTGTKKQFFKGFIKAWICLILFYTLLFGSGYFLNFIPGIWQLAAAFLYFIFIFACGVVLSALLYHGVLYWYTENTVWGNIRSLYTGKISDLLTLIFTGNFLTLFTAGIYKAWYQTRFMKYITENIQFGNLRFGYNGTGKELFRIYLKGFLLGLITLGIYQIWFYRDLYNYTVSRIVIRKGDQEFSLRSGANSRDVFEMLVGNALIVVFTAGIGSAWAYIRYYRFIINHCIIPAELTIEELPVNAESAGQNGGNWLDRLNPVFLI